MENSSDFDDDTPTVKHQPNGSLININNTNAADTNKSAMLLLATVIAVDDDDDDDNGAVNPRRRWWSAPMSSVRCTVGQWMASLRRIR